MCGLAALFEPERQFSPALLSEIDRDLYHRGPDSGGRFAEPGAALVFRRLAILDPEPRSDQPMQDPSGRFVIVFNGEIYNYRQLRAELAQAGVEFRGDGDTEAILQGYITWGEAVLDRLEGMYAFVIWDRQERVAVAARDPLGIKPLYMVRQGGLTAFASEMRPLRRLVGTEPDREAMAELLMFRYAAGRHSNLKGIELVPGGCAVRLDLASGRIAERRFCDVLETFQPDDAMSEKEAVALIEGALVRSIEDHLQSDVGYAVQLSGGIDSSLVTAVASERCPEALKTYGVSLGDLPQDEGHYRRLVVDRYRPDHREVRLTAKDYADAMPRAAAHMEGPVPHFGCTMLMLLCDRIRETDKVVLTGEGADEFFGGYNRYGQWRELRKFGRLARLVPAFLWPLLSRYRGIKRFAGRDAAIDSSIYFDVVKLHEVFPDYIPAPGAREAAAARFSDFRDRMIAADQVSYLPSLLMRQDKMAMAASVEARVPFTHLPLARVANRIPRHLRIPGGTTKPLLKEVARKWLPEELIDRRKIGLVLPLADWLEDPNGLGRYLDYMAAPDSGLGNFTDRKRLRALVEDFRGGHRDSAQVPLLGHLMTIEAWLRTLDGKGEFAHAA